MSLLFRIFQHLLPRATAWSLTVDKTLRRFFLGLAGWIEADNWLLTDSGEVITTEDGSDLVVDGDDGYINPKRYSDDVFFDIFPDTTLQLAEWEHQFGLDANSDEATRRLNLSAEWAATGGQSPSYLQGVLQTAGFDVFVHEWWSSVPPYVLKDPHDFTVGVLIGEYQCTAHSDLDHQPQCTGFTVGGLPLTTQPQCNNFLQNDPNYLVNLDLTPRAPPPIPSDSSLWPFFVYIGDELFPDHAAVPLARRAEFERLLLKLRPAHLWIVTLVDYVP